MTKGACVSICLHCFRKSNVTGVSKTSSILGVKSTFCNICYEIIYQTVSSTITPSKLSTAIALNHIYHSVVIYVLKNIMSQLLII